MGKLFQTSAVLKKDHEKALKQKIPYGSYLLVFQRPERFRLKTKRLLSFVFSSEPQPDSSNESFLKQMRTFLYGKKAANQYAQQLVQNITPPESDTPPNAGSAENTGRKTSNITWVKHEVGPI